MSQARGLNYGRSHSDPATAATNNTSAMVEVKNLRKSFGSLEVLRGIDLTIGRRETLCVIGPSGSGKTTLLRCVNYLEIPTDGQVWVDGELMAPGRVNTYMQEPSSAA